MSQTLSASAIRDQYGRSFDSLDAMRLHLMARAHVPEGQGYSIASEDGAPLAGFVPAKLGAPMHHAVARGWSRVQC